MRPPNAMRRERGEPTRTMRPPNAKRRGLVQMLRCKCCERAATHFAGTCCFVDKVVARLRGLCDLRTRCEESAASRRGLCDLRTRCEESAARRQGQKKCSNPILLADAFLFVYFALQGHSKCPFLHIWDLCPSFRGLKKPPKQKKRL